MFSKHKYSLKNYIFSGILPFWQEFTNPGSDVFDPFSSEGLSWGNDIHLQQRAVKSAESRRRMELSQRACPLTQVEKETWKRWFTQMSYQESPGTFFLYVLKISFSSESRSVFLSCKDSEAVLTWLSTRMQMGALVLARHQLSVCPWASYSTSLSLVSSSANRE